MSLEDQDIKTRLPRIERSDDFHVDDETTHLWAISYADFLMVLLSFFILFFSVDSEVKQDVIQRILKDTQLKTTSSGMGGGSARGPSGIAGMPTKSLVEALKGLDIKIEESKKKIILEFPDNIYSLGQFQVTSDIKNQMGILFKSLTPYYSQIQITFVGHTDQMPFFRNDSMLKDNFDLSVMRATKALQYSLSLGTPIDRVSAKGSADASRNSRTLSLIIEPK